MAESRTPAFTVDWNIEKGMMLHPIFFRPSYKFVVVQLQNTIWRLEIETTPGHLCVWIARRFKNDAGPVEVSIECDFDLLFMQQESDVPHSLRGNSPAKVKRISLERGEWIQVNVTPLSALDDLKDEDMLLLRCRIWPSDSSSFPHPVRHLVRTETDCPEFFTWTVKDFSLLQKGDTRCYVVQETKAKSTKKFDLYLARDNDTINIREIVSTEFYMIHSICVVDASGEKTICLENCKHLPGLQNIFSLRVRKSKLLEEKEKFLPNDQLTLSFELSFGKLNGVLVKEIIGDPMGDDNAALNTSGINRKDCTVQSILTTSCSPDNSSISLTEDLALPLSNTANHHTCPLTDLELRIRSETFLAHKVILAARSPVLLDILTNYLRESFQQGVDLEDLEVDTMKHLMEYLDSVPDLDWNLALNLYSASNKYRVVGLRKKCSEILKSKLCVQNVCPILSVADTHADDDLKQFVLEFISQNEGLIILSHEWEDFANENKALAYRVVFSLYKKRLDAQD